MHQFFLLQPISLAATRSSISFRCFMASIAFRES